MNEFLRAGKSAIAVAGASKDRFREGLRLLDTAAASISEAGDLFASIDPEDWANLIEEAPAPMRRTLGYVRAVGEGKMIPQLATAAGEAAQRLRGLPLADQAKLWAEPVEMFAPGRTGRHAKYMRYATEMNGEEVKRAFERSGDGWSLRSYDEQRAWETLQAGIIVKPEKGVDRPGRWAVRNGKVYLAKAKVDNGLTRRDVESILRDLEEET